MEARSRFIPPERMGLWVLVAFGIALVALIVASMAMQEARLAGTVTQVEVLKLNDRIKALEMKQAAVKAAEPAPMPAMPAAPAQ